MAKITHLLKGNSLIITLSDDWAENVRIPALVTDREGAILKEALKDPVASAITTDDDTVNKSIETLKSLQAKAADVNESAKGYVKISVEMTDSLDAFNVLKDGRIRNENAAEAEVLKALKELQDIYTKVNLVRVLPISKKERKTAEIRAEKMESAINIGMKKGDIHRVISVTADGDGGFLVTYISKAAVHAMRTGRADEEYED